MKLERMADISLVLSIVVGVPLTILAYTKGPMWLIRPGVVVMFALSIPLIVNALLLRARAK